MASLVLSGDTSGSVTLAAPAVAGSTTQTLVNVTGTLAPLVSGTVNAGGTNPFPSSGGPATVDFTGIPSWVKRITVMFQGVSTNGGSAYQVQLGTTSGFVTTGYTSGVGATTSTTGLLAVRNLTAATLQNGVLSIQNITGNGWVSSGVVGPSGGNTPEPAFGSITLSGTLDRVRITTVNGTDTFDAGSINILYE